MQDRPLLDPALYPAGTSLEPAESPSAWPAIWAGAIVAIAVTLTLGVLGSGIGLSASAAWPGTAAASTEFTIGAGIWLVAMQWASSALGGYVAGRMRGRWFRLHADEVFFRDTVHGLVTWAMATIIVASLAALVSALAAMNATVDPDVSTQISTVAAEAARKSVRAFAFFGALAMVIGAFVACVSAVIGGRLRDRHP